MFGGVNMREAQITFKNILKQNKLHKFGGRVSSLNWGVCTPPLGGVRISLLFDDFSVHDSLRFFFLLFNLFNFSLAYV